MKNRTTYYFLICVLYTILSACDKQETNSDVLGVEKVIVFQDQEVDKVYDVVVNGDVALCFYSFEVVYMMQVINRYKMKLIDKQGNEIWDREIGHNIGVNNDGYVPYLDKVLVDKSDNSFAIFFGNSLLKVDKEGNEIYFEEDFLNLTLYEKLDIFQDDDFNFIIVGTRTSRAFVAKYSPTGEELFRKLYFISVPGVNAFTSGVCLPDGGYLIAGTKESTQDDIQHTLIIAKVANDGAFEWIKHNELGEWNEFDSRYDALNVFGRELLPMSDGNYLYVMSTTQLSDTNQLVYLRVLNDSGDILKTNTVDLARANYPVGSDNLYSSLLGQRLIGRGFIPSFTGGFVGLVNTQFGSTLFDNPFETQQLGNDGSYYYKVDETGEVWQMNYFDRRSAISLNSINSFSNGELIAVGSNLSFGEVQRLTVIIF